MFELRGYRRIGMAGAGLVSVAGFIVLSYHLVTPRSLAAVSTPELVAVLALAVLPALTLWAATRRPVRPPILPEPAAPSARRSQHEPDADHPDRAERHRRRTAAIAPVRV